MSIAIFTLTSVLHNEVTVEAATKEFLGSLDIDFEFKGADYSTYGSHNLNLIYVRTGGTEGVFKSIQDQLMAQSSRPFYLLTSGKANSLAASMEILSYLRQNGLKGEILHGSIEYINGRIRLLEQVETALKNMNGLRLGIVGQPSDWLISSKVCPKEVKEKLGIELVDITIDEVLETLKTVGDADVTELLAKAPNDNIREALPGAMKMYLALKKVVENNRLSGFTIRCFDMLGILHNTACLALAKLNAEGIVAGCEGDVPTMLSMVITRAVTGVSGFQANPSRIDPETGEMLFAHCTIPLNMVRSYELDTHFESGIGVGIRGYVEEGPVTIFKVSGDLTRCFTAQGTLLRNQAERNLCRTQQIIRLDNKELTHYFLTDPIGNHHVILPGHQAAVLEAILR